MYEHFDHTADLGFRLEAATMNQLFIDAGHCLFAAIVEHPETIQPNQTCTITLTGTDREYLLFDWLRELLLLAEMEKMVFSRFEVSVHEEGLSAKIYGEPLDPERHGLNHEVKAITYHNLKVEASDTGFRAEVIVDI